MIDETLIIRNEKIPDPAPPGAPFTADVIGNILDHSDRQASAHEDEAVSIEAIRKRAAAILGNGNSSTQRKSKRQREQGKRWLRMFEELLLFKVVNGHTKVPNYYPQCQELGSWVACLWRQHRELQEGKISNLTREKMDVLGLVGFWGISRSSFNSDVRGGNVNVSSEPHICQGWNLEFEGLKEYKRKFDDTLVPKNHDSSMRCPVKRTTNLNTTDKLNKRLNMEISNAEKSEESREKSTSYVSGEVDTGLQKLRKSKRQKKKEEKWLEMFHRLKLYKELTGHCDVPQWCPGNQELGSFVASQRDHYRYFQEGKSFSLMTDEKLSILTSIGFIWEPLLNAQVTCRKGTLVDDDSGESNEVTQPLLSPVDDSYVPTSPARVDKDLVEKYSIALATASRKGQSSIQHALFSQQPRILAEEVNVKSDMVLSIRNSGALLQQDFLCEKSSLQAPMKESSPDEKVDFEDSDKCATLAKNTKDLDSERPIVAKWKLKKGDTTNFPNCYLPLYKGVTVRPSGKWVSHLHKYSLLYVSLLPP